MGILNKPRDLILMCIERITELNIISIEAAMTNERTFLPYKNYCQSKELVVCGAGPSLQKYRPIDGAVHIALNRAFLFERVKFDFIYAQDYEGINRYQEELINYRSEECVKFLGTTCGDGSKEIPESFVIKCAAHRFVSDGYIYRNGYRSKFVRDIDKRAIGSMPNIGLAVMQLALFMNPEKIYLVGCDMSGGHFTNTKQSKNEIETENQVMNDYWQDDQKKLLVKWKELKQFTERFYPETEIVSVNPVGLRGIFQDWDQ